MNPFRDIVREQTRELLNLDIRDAAGVQLSTISDDLANRLRDHGSGTVRALLWNRHTFHYPRHWLQPEEDALILGAIWTVEAWTEFFFSIQEFVFWEAVKLPGEYLPGVNNPAGEFVIDPTETGECDALPWRSTPRYEALFEEDSPEGHVEGA